MSPIFLILAAGMTFPPLTEYSRLWHGRVNGVYWQQDVYAALPDEPFVGREPKYGQSWSRLGNVLYRGASRDGSRANLSPIVCGWTNSGSSRLRLSIFNDSALLDHSQYFPIAFLPLMEPTGLGNALFKAKYPEYAKQDHMWPIVHYIFPIKLYFPEDRPWPALEPAVRLRVQEDPRYFYWEKDEYIGMVIDAYMSIVRFDMLPIDDKSLLLFSALDDTLSVSVEPVPGRDKPPKFVPPRALRTGKLPAGFRNHFHAYRVGDHYYLVTASGVLYKCALEGKAGLKITEVWSDPARPLIGIVDCPETKQAFAFGWGSKPGNTDRYWIEFGDKPQPTAYKLAHKLAKKREDAWWEVAGCVDALKAMKAVKPVPKK